jgi:hypothetical protein
VLKSPGYTALSHVRNLLVNVNSAINFLLYCVFGQKFRRVFLMTFCRQCPKKVCGHSVSTGSARSAGSISQQGSGRFPFTGSARSTGVVSTAGIGMCGGVIGGGIGVFDHIPLDQRDCNLRRLSIGDDDVVTCNGLLNGSLRTRGGDSTRRLLQTGSGVLCEGVTAGGGPHQSGRLVHCRLLGKGDQMNANLPMFV